MCTLNGRFNLDSDNFTCISTKGKSVIDYFLIPQDVFGKCQNFNVYSVTDLINECQLANLIGDKSKPSDHSVLHVNFTIREIDNINSNEGGVYVTDGNHINNNLQNNVFNSRRYKFITFLIYS